MAPQNEDTTTGFVGSSTPSVPAQNSQVKRAVTKLPTGIPITTSSLLMPCRASSTISPTLSTTLQNQRQAQSFNAPAPAAGVSGTAVVLFRSDLRLDDHPALTSALEKAATVVPVYCFDPRHFGRTPHGFDKTGKYRARFLIESVRALRDAFRSKGTDLVVRIGRPEDVVTEIASRVNAAHVMLHKEVTYEDQQVERDLEKALKKTKSSGVEMHLLWANTLYHRDDMPFRLQDMPDVYSDFREAVEIKSKISDPLQAPKEMPPLPGQLDVGEIPTLSELGISESGNPPPQGIGSVRGGEKEALQRVMTYVKDARKMEATSPKTDGVSASIGADFSCRISPWLALGCVSPRRIFKAMKDSSAPSTSLIRSSTYFELVWRDFFRCITAKYSEKRAVSSGRKPAAAKARTPSLARV